MRIFYKIRILIKFILRKFIPVECFCRICGMDVKYDFVVSNDFWNNKIRPYIKKHHIKGEMLCYYCFCDICEKIGESTTWKLKKL